MMKVYVAKDPDGEVNVFSNEPRLEILHGTPYWVGKDLSSLDDKFPEIEPGTYKEYEL